MVLLRNGSWLTVLLGAMLVLLGGCSKNDLTSLHPIKGKVLVAGKPFEGLNVTLYSVALRTKASTGMVAVGTTDADGEFTAVPNTQGGEIPPGEYIVTVCYDPPAADVVAGLEGRSVSRNVPSIDRTCMDAAKSQLRIQVSPASPGEAIELPPIQLP